MHELRDSAEANTAAADEVAAARKRSAEARRLADANDAAAKSATSLLKEFA